MESSPIDVHPNTLSPKPSDKIVEEPPLETTTLPNEKAVEDHVVDEEPPFETMTLRKKTRGPTKMKTIAVEKQSRVDIVFNEYGQPINDESVGLASFLEPLVREVVPVNLENWLKLPTRVKSRYNVEDWQKKFFFKKIDDWMDFVSEKTSEKIGWRTAASDGIHFSRESISYPVARRRPLPYLFDFSSPQSLPSSILSCADRCGKMEREEDGGRRRMERDEKKMVEDGVEKMMG
ncbi:Plant transposase [Cucumis melo var. makuwa]|uniref:Plant transposase n=1 Tax=Cucumis melo var. makuwa TaxID=1194695 RepID=A0A5A7UXH0_CUCMM|nr:Plant transposase [Cucumis melo var. makuwa]